jgi:hypothetical protein
LLTVLRGRTRSGFSSVTLKKNRSAAMAALIIGAGLRLRNMQLIVARSSLVAASADRPSKAPNFLTLRA